MFSIDIIIVSLTILFLLISLYMELIGPAFTFMIAVIFLGLYGILEPKEILSGFANEQIAVILLLLLIGDLIRKTEMIEILFNKIFRKARSYRGFLLRMIVWVSSFSAFLNNTPLVAVMMPYIHNWSKKNKLSPSKLLIPLSYAAILGGCITLIGTSTNLIVYGLFQDQTIFPNHPGLDLFDFSRVGIAMLIIGSIYLVICSKKLLPDHKDVIEDYKSNCRKYIVEAKVKSGSHLAKKTVGDAGLRNLDGLFLVEIRRQNYTISAVTNHDIIEEEDILFFAGDTSTIADILNSDSGLIIPEIGMMHHKKESEIVEIVVSHNSPLINKTVKEANFRSKYDAAIIAIHRNGERITGKLGNIKLRAGDSLLLFAGKNFTTRTSNTLDFYLISKIRDIQHIELYKVVTLLGGTAIAILLSAFNMLPLFLGLISVVIISMILKIASPKNIQQSIDYNLAIIIALSLALGTAMTKSGFADLIANQFIHLLIPYGTIALLAGIYSITAILAAYITNKAAVAIIFPISLTLAKNIGLDPIPFVLVVAFAAAANFMTPIGYQTNLMVYGPGGYSFRDYFRIGFPLTILYGIVCVLVLSYTYNFL